MDLIKHLSLFDPSRFTGTVGVVGLGALGSALAIQLAKLGLTRMVLFDADRVENHNLPNQILYGPDDVGEFKICAAADAIKRLTGYEPDCAFNDWSVAAEAQALHLTERAQLRSLGVTHLFVCVDSMAARKHIFEQTVWLNPDVVYLCEGRMNAREGTLTGFNPTDVGKSREYLARLYPDSDVPVDRGTCGNVLSLGATAMSLACSMTWHFINTHGTGTRSQPYEELSFAVNDLAVHHKGSLVA